MAITSRKSRPLDRSVEHLRDTRLVIIAAEGRITERQYFAMFRSTRVQVKVEAALREAMGGSYSKTNLDGALFLPLVRAAADRAQAVDPSPQGRWPIRPGSHVYRVIRDLANDCSLSP